MVAHAPKKKDPLAIPKVKNRRCQYCQNQLPSTILHQHEASCSYNPSPMPKARKKRQIAQSKSGFQSFYADKYTPPKSKKHASRKASPSRAISRVARKVRMAISLPTRASSAPPKRPNAKAPVAKGSWDVEAPKCRFAVCDGYCRRRCMLTPQVCSQAI